MSSWNIVRSYLGMIEYAHDPTAVVVVRLAVEGRVKVGFKSRVS